MSERIVKRLNEAVLDDELLEAIWAEEEISEEFEKLEAQVLEKRTAKEENAQRIVELEKQIALLLEKINLS